MTSYPGQSRFAFLHLKQWGRVWSHLIRRSTHTRQPLLRGAFTVFFDVLFDSGREVDIGCEVDADAAFDFPRERDGRRECVDISVR